MKKLSVLLPLLLTFFFAKAQYQDLHISLEAQGIATTNKVVPFWLRANQFGSTPLSGTSGSLILKIRKDYDTTKTFGWAASFEGRGNVGTNSEFILVEGFVKAHAGIFELKAGRSKEIVGLVDSTLSSGSFAVSGNALGVPKVSIGIPNYYSIPVLGKLFAIKAAFTNGYAGFEPRRNGTRLNDFKTYYLENFLYGKIGKPGWRFNLEAGFNHEVLWGDEKKVFGSEFTLSTSEAYWYVVSGKVYDSSKVGNHLGSVDIGAEYRFDALTLKIYRQSFYDKGALWSLANIKDGLNGVSLTNNSAEHGKFYWRKILFEVLYTANQAGTLQSKTTESGAEDYYNNYQYAQGWSYRYFGLGTPFITTIYDARSDANRAVNQFFLNNRLYAFHVATQFDAFNWAYTFKSSFSHNMGTYASGSEPYRSVKHIEYPPKDKAFKAVNQLSLYLSGLKALRNGYSVGYDLGYDHGELLYNSFGVILKVSKTFL
ncbi:capsule assembly Wzi family protein [Mucilaginibacter sp.]|uniref:capsule assembly Wzi family protein n=1 Tax=Mucilaginibacter sp. TaxID=1882438 RepID=UPI002ED0F578